jgi:hypothetical protein
LCVLERTDAVGRIFNAVGAVMEKRKSTRGRILEARGVANERLRTNGRVVDAGGVAKERLKTDGRVVVSGVTKEGHKAVGRVVGA